MRKAYFFTFLSLFSFPSCAAEYNTENEILFLINQIEISNCTFHRNNNTHTSIDAANHMRLKLKRGARHAKTTEQFISRLASKSSFSGRPYHIECQTGELITMNDWLNKELLLIRNERNL